MVKTKKARGRPAKPDSERKRNNLTIRMRDNLRKALSKIAIKNQRSLSEEAEFRLENSFQREPVIARLEECKGVLDYVALKVAPPSIHLSFVRDGNDFLIATAVNGEIGDRHSLVRLLHMFAAWNADQDDVDNLAIFLHKMGDEVRQIFAGNQESRETITSSGGKRRPKK